MLEFLTWNEVVDDFVQEGNLKMAAIFDLDGIMLAGSKGVDISQQEAQDLIQSLQIPGTTLFGLFLGGVKINCMRVDDKTLIGRTSKEVCVAYLTDSVLICGFTPLDNKSSCLRSVKDFALKLNSQSASNAVDDLERSGDLFQSLGQFSSTVRETGSFGEKKKEEQKL